MKKIREIDELERDILLKSRIKSPMSLGILFYIMGILLPFFTCMIITRDFTYLYMFLIGLIVLLFMLFIYPLIYYGHLQTGKIECFESVILSCKRADIYYYKVEIEGVDGHFLPEKFPVLKRVKSGKKIVVVMLLGKNKPRHYLLLDKEKEVLLTSKRTRYDLID